MTPVDGAGCGACGCGFVSRAPAEVVEREREKLTAFAEQRARLAHNLATLEGES